MKKVITTMLVAAMVLSMAMPTSAATITRKKSTGTTASTTKVSGDYSLKMVDKTLQFIRGGKVVSSIETKDGKITLRKSSAGGVSVVFTDANGKRRNITLGKQTSVALSGTFVQVSVDKALGSSFEVEMEKGSKVTNFYAKGAAKVTLNGSVTTLNVTSSNANVAANGTVSRAYAVNKKAISGMSSGKITQTSTGTSASGSVNTTGSGSSNSSNTTVNNGSGSGSGSTSGGSNGIIINGGGSNGGTVVTTTAAKEAAKITTAKIGTASVKVGATDAEVKAAVEAKTKILVASGYTVTFNQTKAADTSKAGATSVTGTFTVSKGSDKATTKAMTISVNVTAVTIPAVIEKVVAENGLVNIILENNPSVTPTDANFNPVIKAYINGGAAADLAGLEFKSYEESSKTVVYSFTKIAATEEDQSVVVGAKLGNANEVKADAFKIPAIVKAEIAAVKATNGTIEIELVENPSTDVTPESFAPVIKAYIDGAEGIDLKDLAFGDYNSTTKTVSYTFTAIEATDAEQSVVVGAKLGAADEVKAEAFKVPAKGATVEAEIASVTAENGKISVVLKEDPTTEPTGENFTPVIKAYINGSETGADLTGLTFGEYNSTTKTVSYTFTNIPATDADQTVVIGVKLADAAEVKSNEFKIDAATTEAEAGDIIVTVATGANKTTFVEGDEDAYLEATVALAENTTGTLGDLTYQWLRGTNSNIAEAKPIADANLAKYELKADNQIGNGSYYFCKVVNTVGTTTKEAASRATSYLKVTYPENAAETPAFSKNIVPADDKVDADAYIQGAGSVTPLTVTVTPPSSGTAVVTYKWFVTNDKSKAGSEIEGASGTLSAANSWTASYTPKTTAAEAGTNYYYCEVTNTDEAATPTNPDYKAITVKSEVATIVVKSNLSIVAKANGSNTEDSTKITVSFSNKGAINIPLDAFTIADETIPEGETSKISLGGMPVQVEGGISYELPLAGSIPTNGHKVVVTIDASKLPEGVSLISNTAVVALNKNMSVTSTATVSKVEAVNGTDGTVDTTKVKVIFDSPVYATDGTSNAPYDAFTFDNFIVSSAAGSVETNANKTEYTLTGRPDTTGLTSSDKTEDINLTTVDHTKLSATAANIPTGKGAVTISRDVTAPTLGAPVLSADYTTLTIPVSEAIDVTSGTMNNTNFTVATANGTPITVKSATLTNPTTIKVVLNNAFPSGESGTVTYVAAGSSNAITIKDVSQNANEMADGTNADFGTAVDATAPSFVSAETTAANTIVVHTNRALDALPLGAENLFTVSINGTTETASSVALLSSDSNKGVTITTTSTIAKGNAVKVTYTPDATDASKNVMGENGKPLAEFTDKSVDYSVPATPIPTIAFSGGSLQKKYYTTDSIPTLTITESNFDTTTPITFSTSGVLTRGTTLTASFKVTANDGYDFNGLSAAALASAWGIDADMITVALSENNTVATVTINFGTVKEKINNAIALTGFSTDLSNGDSLSVTPNTTVDGIILGAVTWTESTDGEVIGTAGSSKTYTAHIAVSAEDNYEFDTSHTITTDGNGTGDGAAASTGTFTPGTDTTTGEITVVYEPTAV